MCTLDCFARPAAAPVPVAADDAGAAHLSGHELRCLFKRIAALREQAQLAVLGADAARAAEPAAALDRICSALHEAELQIAQAERLAARQID
ncbi:hypothetical protein [Azohydromonas aeria]|uniref:hypothetical protein n=1 Tax=Azohydromonas aeria TaxID=2590212 RepID=UPI0012FACAD9|nr:hypothetical protein [Azohydromonas aeria]